MSRAALNVAFTEAEVARVMSALNVLADTYDALAAKETHPGDKLDLTSYADSGRVMLVRFRCGFDPRTKDGGTFPLTPGDLSVLERALRMSTAKWQGMIKPEMTPTEKANLRASADEVAAIITRLRKERGLPW